MMNQHPSYIRNMHWSIHKHGNMAIWHSIGENNLQPFVQLNAWLVGVSSAILEHLAESNWTISPQGCNNWKHKDRQVQIAWNKNPSDNTQLQIDFEDGCIGRVNQTWSFFLVVYFSQDVFWAGGSAFFVKTFRKNTSSVVMEEYSKWEMDSKQNLYTFK